MVKLQPDARAERTLERRQQLLDAALDLMGQRGFVNTSVEDLARAAGVAKGTVYLYFPTKEAVLESLLASQSLLPELQAAAESLQPETTAEELVNALVPTIWNGLQARKRTIGLFLRESIGKQEYGQLLLEKILPSKEALATHLSRALQQQNPPAATSDEPANSGNIDLLISLRALVCALVGLFVEQELLGGKQLRPMNESELIDTVSKLFLRGMLQ